MSHSWRSLGTPIYQKQYFQSILEAFGDKVRIFVAYKDDTPVATAFNGHHRDTVEGMWAGSLPEYQKPTEQLRAVLGNDQRCLRKWFRFFPPRTIVRSDPEASLLRRNGVQTRDNYIGSITSRAAVIFPSSMSIIPSMPWRSKHGVNYRSG